ncbi:MAG: DUF6036 family nucleotidyltransferase [Blastocatellia bacterium]
MKKESLFDLIRRVTELSGVTLPIIVGSQTLYSLTDQVPQVVRGSLEADFLLAGDDSDARLIVNKELGVTSNFYDTYGYFADGLGLATVSLAPGWRERLQPLKDDGGKTVAMCLEIHDLAVSKLIAGREKDMPFLCYLLDSQLIAMSMFMERAATIKETAWEGALIERLERFHDHLRSQRSMHDPAPLVALINQLKSQ